MVRERETFSSSPNLSDQDWWRRRSSAASAHLLWSVSPSRSCQPSTVARRKRCSRPERPRPPTSPGMGSSAISPTYPAAPTSTCMRFRSWMACATWRNVISFPTEAGETTRHIAIKSTGAPSPSSTSSCSVTRRPAAASWWLSHRKVPPDSRARESAPLTGMDPFASALDQAAAVRRREVSSTELTRAYLERIELFNPKLNAFVLTTPELALEQAKAADDANIGYPLRGVPTSVKDLVSLAGYPSTFGSRAFEDYTLPMDFFPVARLKEEGCPILGKTNTSEFGTRPTTEYGLFGATHNPWHLDHSAGGPSGGPAAAGAAGGCALRRGGGGGGLRAR